MKTIIHRFLFVLNSIFAFTLLLSYLLPYISPRSFPLISLLSLTVSPLILLNILFLIYWLLVLNKKFLVSLIALLLGFSHVTSLYRFNFFTNTTTTDHENVLSLMSYNVLSFNRFFSIDSQTVPEDISKLVQKKNPDIICMQEFREGMETDFVQFPYKFLKYNDRKKTIALTIHSKYPIINKGSFSFEHTANNIIYADIVVKSDTIRVYNLHLQSHQITSEIKDLNSTNSKKVIKNIRYSFKRQQDQTEELVSHLKQTPYPAIIMGDFNNTAFSYIYNQIISEGFIDAFKEAGSGFGKTFKFDLFPARIDFILVPEHSRILSFSTLTEYFSDHFPIYAEITLHSSKR
ncbi:endonuclease/exonuclease/phosphatase family protein [Aquimarina sp. ERC-38]|uniref:endonuclease/exonuclease/phosphatase family protein n=1 Tax=Aquimarina sp. ERC-38 TaxID=2949996 RepID=UPI002247319E|nr:endonuclease/exonuclease/phosphatase family protein [Aquimarina sp. ERC-38]UZO79449.1 endonuclease/exonuclease/phosphatase family protein [Aquimarina sp. ERC-38]